MLRFLRIFVANAGFLTMNCEVGIETAAFLLFVLWCLDQEKKSTLCYANLRKKTFFKN